MTSKTKIAIIGTVGIPANYGGFETLVQHLVENLDTAYDMTVYCSGKRYKKQNRQAFFKNTRLRYLPLKANGIQSILYDSITIIHALFYADVLLVLGVAGAWLFPFIRFFTNKKIIVSIDGIEWKREKWGFIAKCYLFWSENLAVKYSHIDISDNESIQDYTAMRYGSLSRIIEYGADHTLQVIPSFKDKNKYPFLKFPYAFSVCRIEPENNIHIILGAFAELSKYTFVLVGNWNNSTYGQNLKKLYGNISNISLLDPIYDQRGLDLLRSNALIYIHGHSAGGTNPSLVEAMYLGLPIIAYSVSYNRITTEDRALYFLNAEELKKHIQKTGMRQLKDLGKDLHSIAIRRYTWTYISGKYDDLIKEAISTNEKSTVKSQIEILKNTELLKLKLGHLIHQHSFFEIR